MFGLHAMAMGASSTLIQNTYPLRSPTSRCCSISLSEKGTLMTYITLWCILGVNYGLSHCRLRSMFQYGLEAICLSLWVYYCTPTLSFHHMISYFLYVATSTLDPLGCHHLSPRLSAAPRFKDANNISYDNLISMTAMAAHEVSWVWEESVELGWSLQLFSVCEVC